MAALAYQPLTGVDVSIGFMDCTARPLASNAWKKTGFLAGIVKYALPSFSTGTVPSTIRAFFLLAMTYSRVLPKWVVFGSTSTIRKAVIFVPFGHGFTES